MSLGNGYTNLGGQLMQTEFSGIGTDVPQAGVDYGPVVSVAGVPWVRESDGEYKRPNTLEQLASLPSRRIVWWGDSTTELAVGNNLIPYSWGSTYQFDSLPGYTESINYGGQGHSTSSILGAAPGSTNVGGNIVTPEGVGAACAGADAVVISFGINDFRKNTNIATYGSPVMVDEVLGLQSRLKTMIERAKLPANFPVIFMVPNTLCATGPNLVGVTGQQVTDAMRAAYIGDESIGVYPLSSVIPGTYTCDTCRIVFGVVSPVTANKPNTMGDELHPFTGGMALRHRVIAEYIRDPDCLGYLTVSRGRIAYSDSSTLDLRPSERTCFIFGNTSGIQYGGASAPAIGVGDIMEVTRLDGSMKRFRIVAPPYQNNSENLIRWVSPPSGTWDLENMPAGSSVVIKRPKFLSSYELFANGKGYKSYPFRVISGGSGTLTIKAIPGGAHSLVDRSPTTGDCIAIASAGGDFNGSVSGLSLASATITPGSNPGDFVITLAGVNFVSSAKQLGSILVPV